MKNKEKEIEKIEKEIEKLGSEIDRFVEICENFQKVYNESSGDEELIKNHLLQIFELSSLISLSVEFMRHIDELPSKDKLIQKYESAVKYIDTLVLKKDGQETTVAQYLNNFMGDKIKNAENLMDSKAIKIRVPNKSFFGILKDSLIGLLMNVIILFALSGFFTWGKWNSYLDLLLFIGYYSLIEVVLKIIIVGFFHKLIIKTLGTILFIPFILSIVCACVFPIFIEFESYFTFILLIIISGLIKKYIMDYFFEKSMKNKINSIKKFTEDE